MKILKSSEVPDSATVISSKTVFKYKFDGTLKALIVPLVHRDPENITSGEIPHVLDPKYYKCWRPFLSPMAG